MKRLKQLKVKRLPFKGKSYARVTKDEMEKNFKSLRT